MTSCDCTGSRSFIESMRFSGDHDHGHHHVWICLECGKLHVTGARNGQHFDVSFYVYMPEHLAVIRKYAKEISMDFYHPFPEDRTRAIQRAQEFLSRDPLFLDTETTGLGGMDEVCEIAILNVAGDVVLDTLVKPSKPIPQNASDIHGITNEMVEQSPTIVDLIPELERILRNREVLIYNAEFDEGMLGTSVRLNGCEFTSTNPGWWYAFEVENKADPGKPLYKSYWHCVMKLYAKFYGDWNDYHGSYRWIRLEQAARQCGIEFSKQIHRAKADAELARLITLHMARWTPELTQEEQQADL